MKHLRCDTTKVRPCQFKNSLIIDKVLSDRLILLDRLIYKCVHIILSHILLTLPLLSQTRYSPVAQRRAMIQISNVWVDFKQVHGVYYSVY